MENANLEVKTGSVKYGSKKSRKRKKPDSPTEAQPTRKSLRRSLMQDRPWKFSAEEKNLYGERLQQETFTIDDLIAELHGLHYIVPQNAHIILSKWRKRIRDKKPFMDQKPPAISDEQLLLIWQQVLQCA
jgi:hypothetical protein